MYSLLITVHIVGIGTTSTVTMNSTLPYSTSAGASNTTIQSQTENHTLPGSNPAIFTQSIPTVAVNNHTNEWATALAIFEGINIALIVIVSWLLLNLIAYGIKTGRFRKKAQSSSLNSGIIYVACVLTIFCLLPRLIFIAITHVARRQGVFDCETFGDIATSGYGISLYAIYMFLWLRQRVIYVHPFVKEKVSVAMSWFSRIYVVFLTAVTVTLMCVFLIQKSYFINHNWCYEDRPAETSYIIGATFFIAQALMLYLCIYPVTTGSIQKIQEEDISEPRTNGSPSNGDGPAAEEGKNEESSKCEGCCFYLSGVVTSPVEMAIKRTVISSVLVVSTDIIAIIIEAVVFPKDVPAVIRQTTIDISSCIDLFCVVCTFRFALEVFTLFCPSCSRKNIAHETTDTGSVAETTVDI